MPTQLKLLKASGLFAPSQWRPSILLLGGEPIDEPSWQMLNRMDAVAVHNVYGPTECTVDAMCCRLRTGMDRPHIGRPLPNIRMYILGLNKQPVPIGVAGELYIGGAGVARGYLNRPELTSERFLPDPFVDPATAEPEARMYKTGDRGRYLPDGNLEFLGRNDFQVKIRGYRIELGEIEAWLCAMDGVKEAAVLAREGAPGDRRLVAYYTGSDELSAEIFRSQLSSRLPEYMVPAAYVRLETLPLTPNGKLDRKALPAPEGDAFGVRAYEAPQGEAEQTLAAIWAELLQVETIGRRDHFFELGGHSLTAVTLISRMRMRLDVELPLAELFAHPVLSELAILVQNAGKSTLPPITAADRTEALPLSFAQQRLWFLDQLEENAGRAYHMPGGIKLTGVLDTAALKAALDRIVWRHEVLRTTFTQQDGVPQQVIAPAESGFFLLEHDLGGRSESELESLVAEEADTPFDLTKGPLIRGRLIRLCEKEHILLVTRHHIVSDGWSKGVLINELGALYQAFSKGQEDSLQPLAIQYADYAVWQRRWLEGGVLQDQLAFWKERLEGAPALLELPTDHPRPAVQDYKGAAAGFVLDTELTKDLKALSRRHGLTLFMTLLAGWAALLARLSHRNDIVIGTPVANRTRIEIEPLIGFFVNTLAMRVDLAGRPSVSELLARVKQLTIEAQSRQEIPFEQVVEAAEPVRSLSHSPLFQVMFLWQNDVEGRFEHEGLELDGIDIPHTTTQFDLSLTMQEDGNRIVGGLEYATALFERETIERYLDTYRNLLRSMACGDSCKVDQLKILSQTELRQVLFDWNATEAAYPKDKCIHQLFEAQVEKTPDAVAVIDEEKRLTYQALNQQANRLAHHLIALGVAPDTPAAICVERSLEMMVGLLAILKAGGAYVPLDPAFPSQRLQFILEDTQAPVLITQNDLSNRLKAVCARIICLDHDNNQIESHPAHNPEQDADPESLAYILHTSGSTGKPKGVRIPHRSVVNFLLSMQKEPGINADDILLAVTTLSFDISVLELFLPLSAGACVVLADQPTAADGQTLLALIRSSSATIMQATPATWQLLFADGLTQPLPLKVLCGGEKLPDSLARQFCRISDSVWNLYGPTETTIWSTCARLEPDGPVTAGRPIANTRLYIVDQNLEPTPRGVAGELLIGGAGVAHGYLDRPELTSETFIPDRFSGQPHRRLYRTGDRARYLSDGTLQILGRMDHQVKLRGFRIEPGEIEARLAAMDGIQETVVLIREDTPGDKRLVAYYTAGEAIPVETLRSHLTSDLPGYMVPAAYVHLEALPLTVNGKLDRNALPAPGGGAWRTCAYKPPVSLLERNLAAIWAELLQMEWIGRHDNFFDLGGHSLMAMQMVSMMKQSGIDVQVAALFTHPTIERLAAYIEGEEKTVLPDGAVPIRRKGEGPPLFIVHEASGDVFYAAALADRIDTDIPVYGLAGTPLGETPLRTMHAEAQRLVRIIRKVQPHGPYRIAGWSLGGNLAYEIAMQLLGDDQDVTFVGLIDSVNFIAIDPQPIPMPIYLFKAIEIEEDSSIHDYDSDGHLGWTKTLPKAQIHLIPVPGTHLSLMSPSHIETLGRSLSDAIRQAGAAKNAVSTQS